MAVTYQCLLLVTGLLVIYICGGGKKKREKQKSPSPVMLYDLDLLYSSISPVRLLWKVIFRCVLSVVPCHSCIHSLDIVVVVYGDEINPNLCRIPLLLSLFFFSSSHAALDLEPNPSNKRPHMQACAACLCKSCGCAEAVINLDSLLSTHTAH